MNKKHICENPKCQKEHDGSYGSGRFCSSHCRRVYVGLKSNQTMKKNGTKKCNFNAKNNGGRKPYGNWNCKRCNLIFETRRQLENHNHQIHPFPKGSSWNKGLTKETDSRVASYVKTCKDRGHYICSTKGKHLSEEHKKKTSEGMKNFLKEHPDRVPFLLNHSSKESYPEQFFRQAFQNEHFPALTQEKYVEGYFLDFALEEKKLYIEIDGEQHYKDNKLKDRDVKRGKILNDAKWKCVCRIRWSKFQKLSDQQKHAFLLGLKKKLI